ncbi:hypothetical protein PN498_11140 [Oscillatoria sp. CS-180]|uniref:hypothetical protein n=1 Tax=Oscillatoria sp. CS-180 TaxID=3021720 RepID=UPI00232E8EB3|nr:hypothetical protein [Oscillatoria sp. CS-180]MDB9526546.1 hypothetical protein [Oscillatoria sp. CS-180]
MRRFNSQPPRLNDLSTRLWLGFGAVVAAVLFIFLLKLLLPWLVGGAVVWGLWFCWQRHLDFQKRLYICFYDHLEMHQGRISALDFAMTAQISGPQARTFLDARAKDFFANFEPTNYGDVVYTFHRTTSYSASSASTSSTKSPPQLPKS